MTKRYKIHPAIGVARVGPSEDGYFIGPEGPGGRPFELSADGEVDFRGYKDAGHLIRREGARFRVYEYDVDDASGEQTFVGEVLPGAAAVRWRVTLGSQKAAGPFMTDVTGPQGEAIIVPSDEPRNDGVARERLMTEAASPEITGANRPMQELRGSIMDRPVLLGEAGTDHRGRLVVLGGKGVSDSWLSTPPPLRDYLNNDGWFDDISDGPVDAVLEFPDGTRRPVDDGAWVLAAPPDFAPNLAPFVTLYDLMFDTLVQAGRLPRPSRVSFEHDVWPILKRAADFRWVHGADTWSNLADAIRDRDTLADPGDAARPARENAFGLLSQSEEVLREYRLTITQKQDVLERWVAGQFDGGAGAPAPASNEAADLDRAVLTRCIGSGLFPGIEMGFMAANPSLYSELGRFTRGVFEDFDGPRRLEPGMVTQRMALPWQADFMECSRRWWPVQRPDTARFREDGSPTPPTFRWDRGLVAGSEQTPQSHLNMVRHFAKLGVVDRLEVGGEEVMAELGRSPELPA